MINKIFNTLFSIAFLTLLLAPKTTEASHIAGGDFQYECIGPNTYLITLNLFRDCDGIGMGTAAQSVSFESPCGNLTGINLPLINPDFGTEVSQLCDASMSNSTCNGGPLAGMQQYIYQDVVVLNPDCDTWTMSWNSCCRNALIENIVNPSGNSLTIAATLNS
ncbi:MAG: hypothetical protein ACPGD5_08495, partial [Salibacteraceae bacterium]